MGRTPRRALGRRAFLRTGSAFVIAGLAGAACASAPRAVERPSPRRIGYLSKAGSHSVPYFDAFRRGLAEQGFVEGDNLAIESRLADGTDSELLVAARELASSGVDLMVTRCAPETNAAKQVTTTLPIVMIALTGDPVGSGVVKSLAHPAGNITGLTIVAPQLSGKRVAVLKSAVPSAVRVAVLYNAANADNQADLAEMRRAADGVGVELLPVTIGAATDLPRAFDEITALRPAAFMTLLGTLGTTHGQELVDFQTQSRLPAMYEFREVVDIGGLLSYGPDLRQIYGRAAVYAAKVLRGAAPSDLPIERPSRFELVVNAGAARALGLRLPPAVTIQAAEIVGDQ